MSPEPLFELETEKSYLGSVLIKNNTLPPESRLIPEDFFLDLHKRIFTSIKWLVDSNTTIDVVAVVNQMKDKALFKNEVQEFDYIKSLFTDTVIYQPLEYYEKRIRKLSTRRKYIKTLKDSMESVTTNPIDNDELFGRIESDLAALSRTERASGLRRLSDDIAELREMIALLQEQKGIQGLSTDYPGLDEMTTGLKSHELMIIAARPGWGKTTLALNIASNVAFRGGKPVAIFSMEMNRSEIYKKLLCAEARINMNYLTRGQISPSDKDKIKEVLAKFANSNVWIDDTGYRTVYDFRVELRKVLSTTPLALIIVDYLQLMSDPSSKDGGRQQEVAAISRALKLMAREANCPIIALSQMSREVEKRTKDQRPVLSDLRESGAIEQDADIVAFIYREDKVKPKEEVEETSKNVAEIIIAKNRSGRTGSFQLKFQEEYGRFDSMNK